MKKKLIVAIVAFVVLVAIAVFAYSRRPRSDVFMELAIWPGGGGHIEPDPGRGVIWHRLDGGGEINFAHHFVLRNDRTLICYSGISRNFYNLGRHDFMRPLNTQERKEVLLSEDEFRNIAELLYLAIDAYYGDISIVLGQSRIALLYDGNIYGGQSGVSSVHFLDLENKLRRLMH